MNAAPSIDDLLARVPQLQEYTVAPPALVPLPQMRIIERELRAAIAASPSDARGYAMLGNLLTRQLLYLQARDAFRRALELDRQFASAHLAAAELSSIVRDEASAREHLHDALRLRRRFDDPLPVRDRVAVLLLLKDEPYAVNAPLEVVLDRGRVALHKFYIGEEPVEAVPEYDAVFVAFGAAPEEEALVLRASRLISRDARILNRPAFLRRCAREALASTLENIPGVRAVQSEPVERGKLSNIELPALVRPVRTHAGYGLAYIESATQLQTHVQRFPAPAYDVSAFVDYRSADGYYRKYRIMIIDGVAYPYHLAISPRWMVHYQSSPMEEHAWMRDEEHVFLTEPASVFPRWHDTGRDIATAVGLQYFGIDVARLPDGSMLVFETDPAMLVHDEDDSGLFAYKRDAVNAIRVALHRLIE